MLISLEARLPRFSRNDGKKAFSRACQGLNPILEKINTLTLVRYYFYLTSYEKTLVRQIHA
jgi:hypothetical protein